MMEGEELWLRSARVACGVRRPTRPPGGVVPYPPSQRVGKDATNRLSRPAYGPVCVPDNEARFDPNALLL
jgi:hypothetical protein